MRKSRGRSLPEKTALVALAAAACALGAGATAANAMHGPAAGPHFTGWSVPVNLGPTINTPAFLESGPALSKDGLSLYFYSNRPGGVGGFDMYMSELQADGSWGRATPIQELNSSGAENRPNIRHDGLEIFFYSDRAGGLGSIDLWEASRDTVTEPWSKPVDVGAPVDTSFAEF